MAKKQSSKKPPDKPKKGKGPKAEKAPPEDSKIKPLDPPPPGAGGGTPGSGDENQAN
ncbi:MAG TPA: hypothetical protein VNM67_20715 [Thermoanaerobaculia bacterium]|jgi:hypothetical protein|nr:hypothetical protein [Thermoanaerobaculia bacterium]